jgi:hypothetical protein
MVCYLRTGKHISVWKQDNTFYNIIQNEWCFELDLGSVLSGAMKKKTAACYLAAAGPDATAGRHSVRIKPYFRISLSGLLLSRAKYIQHLVSVSFQQHMTTLYQSIKIMK